MNNDIKEIKRAGQILDYVDTKEHLQELFNYITNLQERIEDLETRLENEVATVCLKCDEIERLNNIINEAIEYIKENEFKASDGEVCYFCNMQVIKDLLNILQGEDNE